MKRALILLYSGACYLLFLGTFLYLLGFLLNVGVPTSIDTGPRGPISKTLLIDVLLLVLFGVQHSVMARQSFKAWWTRIVPPAIERSTYVLASCLVLIALFWCWHPLPTPVWTITHPAGQVAMWSLFGLGVATVLVATFLINHFELFGLEQAWRRTHDETFEPPAFQTPLLYRIVRHPMQLGAVIVFWATPSMTVGHLLFALGMTGYVFIGLYFEERDLVDTFGAEYEAYQERVPMLVPLPVRGTAEAAAPSEQRTAA
ncbi:MAG: isoprenylcysteine carboxylmethyltransferase family protein [Bacteroidetes bacterium]|jgi:protein-S-isoprenylcysteine O-methyltransferase Ste14|nr:isoprenylcysteine carboxylmethyltransferase family protein [Bacteroidota bacterium]